MARAHASLRLDVKATSKRLGISPRTLYRRLADGIVGAESRGRGRKLFFNEEDIAFLAQVVASGHSVRQVDPRVLAKIGREALEEFEAAGELLHQGRDLVLNALDRLYRTTGNSDALTTLTNHGRNPRRE